MSDVIKGVRFLLETVTVLGLVGGLSTKKSWAKKLVFVLLGLVVTLIWSRYGAPRSPYALTGLAKLGLEIFTFGIGITGSFLLYGKIIGWIYTAMAVINLIGLYTLDLN